MRFKFNFSFKLLSVLFLILLLGSCAHFKIQKLENINNDKDFFSLLSNEYKNFAKYELYEMHDEIDANYFAIKALRAANQKIVTPENPEDWNLPHNLISEFEGYFKKINLLIENKLYQNHKESFSKMIVGFDCWIEQQEENWQIDDIASCKNKFLKNYNLIHEIYVDISTAQKQSKQKKVEGFENINESKKNNISKEIDQSHSNSKSVNLFFNFDQAVLTATEMIKLHNFIKLAQNNTNLTIYITGHADTKGSKKYNLALSYKRAEFVKNFLENLDLRNNIFLEGYGESRLLVNTKDEIKEKQNRRAEVTLK